MKNKMLMCLSLIAATAEIGAVPVKAAIYNYFRAYIPGRDKRVLDRSYHIKMHAKNVNGDPTTVHVGVDDKGAHATQQIASGARIDAIKPWEYLEIDDAAIEGKYIVYDEQNKRHICIKHLSDYPYILNPKRWAAAIVFVAAGVAIAVVSQKN